MKQNEAAVLIQNCAILASLLEVSAYPKPGNVHRTADFPDTTFEHFISGGVAIGESMRNLAVNGYMAARGILDYADIGLGAFIQKAVRDSASWQGGGNINLGIVLLTAPLSAAAGAALSENERIDPQNLRSCLQKVLENSRPEDVISVYSAIGESMSPENLGSVDELDILDEESKVRIRNENMNLVEVFRCGAERDLICKEYSSGYQIIFEKGYPYLLRKLKTESTNTSIVDTFLYLLSLNPDSLIIRKSGIDKAREISRKAGKILESGGNGIDEGKKLNHQLDAELQREKGALNPGTTADLISATIFLALLTGWRP